ncbi:conserved hypothetical protein [Candidatus Glomeribacter gigasporarum BEG34]|uniref:DUF1640 domain-containing protein n=1 Tax=Candidatus Glomeribacter gigasporarum BEG34 TaxID=1070319 RepID=G2JC39_9BURK|nr:hypothetical protein [Candidatus Glomeribacter gigasporarum]CCD30346.1 conserved hypothetical protein [Candidatus Glomeribacter gigasporarum BEG34]
MATATFDTYKFVRKLREAGFNDQQAGIFTAAVQETQAASELATRADLRQYDSAIRNDLEKHETHLRHEMGHLRKDIETKLANLNFDLLKWMVGLFIAQTSLLLALRLVPGGA